MYPEAGVVPALGGVSEELREVELVRECLDQVVEDCCALRVGALEPAAVWSVAVMSLRLVGLSTATPSLACTTRAAARRACVRLCGWPRAA